MKKEYINPEIQVVCFATDEIMQTFTVSGGTKVGGSSAEAPGLDDEDEDEDWEDEKDVVGGRRKVY